jgi:opacity protein-like surface antigen
MGTLMKLISRTLTAVSAVAMLAAAPAPAAAQEFDTSLHNTLLDCMTLQILFASVADNEAEKAEAANQAVGFLTAAQDLSGVNIKDLSSEVDPRKAKILGWLNNKDSASVRLTKSCAAIFKVHKNYLAAGK